MNNPRNKGHTITYKQSPKPGEQYTRHGSCKQCYMYNKELDVDAIPNMVDNCKVRRLTRVRL